MNRFLGIAVKMGRMAFLRWAFKNKSGVKRGISSKIVANYGIMPLCSVIDGLEGCDFSNRITSEGTIESGAKYNFCEERTDKRYVSEATDLGFVPDAKYNYFLSSHCLEQVANSLRELREWVRLIKRDRLLLLILPNREFTIDDKQPVTDFSHVVQEFKNDVREDDLTHLDEILRLHDLDWDSGAPGIEQFKKRSMNTIENRALHQHVFNLPLIQDMFSYFVLEVLRMYAGQEFIVLEKKR